MDHFRHKPGGLSHSKIASDIKLLTQVLVVSPVHNQAADRLFALHVTDAACVCLHFCVDARNRFFCNTHM